MKKYNIVFLLLLFSFCACGQHGQSRIQGAQKTVCTRFQAPQGYDLQKCKNGSFAEYLMTFPLKPMGAKVYYFNGAEKPNSSVYASVMDIDVGKADLQQCADAVMRLRAEYLFKNKLYDKIHFNFTNGFRADYLKWADGQRIKVSGNKVSWYKSESTDYSYNTFRKYMDKVFMYAGTLSLSKELKSIPQDSVRVGDVFIHGGSPGHAVIVVNVAIQAKTHKRIFMIAQSYMPAQSIHILVNEYNQQFSPWYDLNEMTRLFTPEWTFEKNELKRFE